MENGAVINELAHRYIHTLTREEEEVINNLLREFKFRIKGGIMIPTEQGIEVQQPFCIDFSELDLSDCIEIDVDVTTEQDRQKFNRAKQKRETDRIIRESLECGDMDGKYK